MPAPKIKPIQAGQPAQAGRRSLNRTATRWAAGLAAAAALAACGTAPIASAAPGTALTTGKTLTYYAFDINGGPADPGFIPVPGTSPDGFVQGDVLIINDQVTVTHKVNGGYPIV